MRRVYFTGTGHIAVPMVRRLAGESHQAVVTGRRAEVSSAPSAELGIAVAETAAEHTALDVIEIRRNG